MKTITTPQGKVVVDESSKNKNWFIPINNFYIDDCNCIRKSLTNNVEFWAVRKNYYEILVSINFSIHKDLPMVVEDEKFIRAIELLEYIVYCNDNNINQNDNDSSEDNKCINNKIKDFIQFINQEPIELQEKEIWVKSYNPSIDPDSTPFLTTGLITNRDASGQLMAYVKN